MLNRIFLKIIFIFLLVLTLLTLKFGNVYAASCTGSCTMAGYGQTTVCAQSCLTGGEIPALITTTPLHNDPNGYQCWIEYFWDPNFNNGCSCTCDNDTPPPPPDPITCGSNTALVSVNGGRYTSNDGNVYYGDTVSIKPNPLSGRTASLARQDGSVGLSCSDLANPCPASATMSGWWGNPSNEVTLTTFQHTATNWWEQLGECADALTLTVRRCSADAGNTCTSAANNCGQTNTGTVQCDGTCSAVKPAPGVIACSSSAGCNDNNVCTTDVCNNPGTCSSSCTNTNNPVGGTWGDWSACTPSCGSGTQTRTNQCGAVDSQACTNGACIPSWFQSIGGDVYGNGVNSAVSTTPPVGFKGFLVTKVGSNGNVFSKGNIDAGSDLRISESKVYVKNIGSNGMNSLWPQGGFTPPSSAVAISNCSGMFTDSGVLDSGRAYKADSSCFQTGLNSLGSSKFKLSNNGVVVIYVTGSTPIKFSNNFNSPSTNKKIIIISNPKIIIGGEIGSVSPDKTKPDIEAVLISNTEIYFESLADLNDSVYDKSMVIEGSIVSPVITFLRNTGKSNYPAELVVYNPYYLTQLLQQEKSLGYLNYTGLMVQESLWGGTQ